MQWKEALNKLLDEWVELKIHYEPLKKTAQYGEVLIGFGEHSEEGGAVFNHKELDYPSATELIYFSKEHQLLRDIPIHEIHFYLDEFSPDSCLAIILFYCLHQGAKPEQPFEEWVEYVGRWEQGDMKTTGEPFESWGCLHSALAHSQLSVAETSNYGERFTVSYESESSLGGFYSCINLAASMLYEDIDPYEVPELDYIEEYNRAIMYLRLEYQKYLQAVKQATIVQLELPMTDSRRTLLVDALIITGNIYIGLLQSFLLHDKERTWLKSGFGFMAIHRPELKGTGKDMVITVDPHLHVHLSDLWFKLEELENERWGDQRPTDSPRFPDRSPANEPWYDDRGRYQLLTAPRRIGNCFGSKLEWADVVAAIWELYNPAESMLVSPYMEDGNLGPPCRIYECSPVLRDESYQKQFVAVKWDSLGNQQTLVNSPSMKRYLAVCAIQSGSGHTPPIHPLPSQHSFDFIELSCGFAVIHTNGILILDDWNNENLDLDLYKNEVANLLKRLDKFQRIHADVRKQLLEIRSRLRAAKPLSGRELSMLTYWTAKQKLEIRNTLLTTMPASIDYYLIQFRETVEKRWGLNTQLNQLYETVSELETIVQNYSDTRTNQLINMITIFGFPLALFGGLFEFIFEGLPSPDWIGVHWTGLFTFLTLSGISIWILRQYFRKTPYKRIKNKLIHQEHDEKF